MKQQAGAIRTRLFVALILSALLHGYFFYQPLDQKTPKKVKPEVLTVAIAPKKAPKVTKAPLVKPAPKQSKPQPKPVKSKAKNLKPNATPTPQKTKVVPIAASQSQPTITAHEPFVSASKIKETSIASAIPEAQPATEPAWAQKKVAPVDTALPNIEDPEVIPYLQVNSLYNVYADTPQQASRAVLGKAMIKYTREQNQYDLHSEVRPSGIMRLFLDDLIQDSRGAVTPNGLKPDYFRYQYDEKKYEVNFDWAAKQLKMHSHRGDQSAAMQAGTQDLLSFLFQFMFTSPLSQTGMMVTNGKGVREYRYQFMGEKLIETELGVFNTLHIVREDAIKNEQLSLWLAVDYQYLPVKIKKTKPNKNKNYELVIRQLQTDQGEIVGESASNVSVTATDAEPQKTPQRPNNESNQSTSSQPFNPLIQR